MTTVLFVQGAGERGGAERVLASLVQALPRQGVRPVVAALAAGPFVDELETGGVEVVRLPGLPRARELRRSRAVARAVARVAREHAVDVIHSNGEKMALFGGPAARMAGTPSIVWLHDAPARSLGATGIQLALLTRRHDALVAPSQWMSRMFRRRVGVHAEVIPHGVDTSGLDTAPLDLHSTLELAPETVVVGHVARLQRWKGADTFLRAAAEVTRHDPAVHFVVAGGALYGWEEEYAASLPPLAADLGIADRVSFLGHREDALAVMAGCDVVVHASRRPEPFGMVVLEAMGLGRAVVATRTGGPEELIEPGRTGLLVAPGDATRMAAAIVELVADSTRRAQLGAAAADVVCSRWSSEAMAGRFAALYGRVTASRERTGA